MAINNKPAPPNNLGSNIPNEEPAPVVKELTETERNILKGLVKIRLHDTDEIPPTRGLYIGYNERSFMLHTGVEVWVPEGVVGILDDAVTSTPVLDPLTKKVMRHRPKHRFAFDILSPYAPGRRAAA